jgi:hypothetical protein
MQITQKFLTGDRRCPCGALLERGMRRCRKCRARSRWRFRQAQQQAHRARPVAPRKRRARPVRGGR